MHEIKVNLLNQFGAMARDNFILKKKTQICSRKCKTAYLISTVYFHIGNIYTPGRTLKNVIASKHTARSRSLLARRRHGLEVMKLLDVDGLVADHEDFAVLVIVLELRGVAGAPQLRHQRCGHLHAVQVYRRCSN